MPSRLQSIELRSALNSSGHMVACICVSLDDGTTAYESAPLGTTTGRYDAKAVDHAEASETTSVLRRELTGAIIDDQSRIDAQIKILLADQDGKVRGSNISTPL